MLRKLLTLVKKNSMFASSFNLMLATAATALFGFIFWIVVARSFRTSTVGLATTLISMTSLISLLGLAGFDTTLIRFLPKSHRKNDQINSGLIIAGVLSAALAALFCLLIPLLSSKLEFVDHNILYVLIFMAITILTTWNTLTNSILVAYHKTSFVLAINIVFSAIKMCLPFVVHDGGPITILVIVGVAQLVNVILSLATLAKYFHYIPSVKVHFNIVRENLRFGATVYLSNILNLLPDSALPLIVVNKLGASAAAYFYIAFTIANLLYTIAFSTAQVVLAEASSDDDSRLLMHLQKGMKVIAGLMIPAVAIIVVISPYLLGAFGHHYRSGATNLLRIMSISGLAIMISSSLGVFFKLTGYLKAILVTTASNSIVIVLLSLVVARHWGLDGIGWVWLCGSVVSVIVGLIFLGYRVKLSPKALV